MRKLVGVIHLPPLPGSPRSKLGVAEIVRGAVDDARALADAGFDVAMIENFGDTPFFAGAVPRVTVAAMAACAVAIRAAAPSIALGVNVLRNDADAALAIAAVAGASCIRVNVHTGARVTDQGLVQGEAATTLRRRRELAAEVAIWADVDVKHSAPLAPRPIADEARDLVERGLADAVLVTGAGTGLAASTSKIREVRAAIGTKVPILVASGATVESLPELAALVDGIIVGSALRDDGVAGGPIDRARASSFADAFARAFGRKS